MGINGIKTELKIKKQPMSQTLKYLQNAQGTTWKDYKSGCLEARYKEINWDSRLMHSTLV